MPVSRKALRNLFFLHGVATLAAGIILVVRPGLIPGLVGASLGSSGSIIAHLLAGAEFGFSVLSFECARSADERGLPTAARACAAFHGTSALLELHAYLQGLGATILLNVAVRVVAVALFLAGSSHDRAPRQ